MAWARRPARRLSTCEDAYLRRKIDVDAPERLIHTVRGAGYRLGAKSIPARTAVSDGKRLRTPAILVGANSSET